MKRIVSVEEQPSPESAAFIQRMGVSVGSIFQQEAMGHSLGSLQLQCVVSGDALGTPVVRIWIEADVWSAQSRVPIGERERTDRRLHLLGQQRIEVGIRRLEAVAVNLAVNRVARRSHAGLVERNRQRLMYTMISDVSDGQHDVVFRLPLQVKAPVF